MPQSLRSVRGRKKKPASHFQGGGRPATQRLSLFTHKSGIPGAGGEDDALDGRTEERPRELKEKPPSAAAHDGSNSRSLFNTDEDC